MAEYFTHWSFEVENITPEEAEWLETEIAKRENDEERDEFFVPGDMEISGQNVGELNSTAWFSNRSGEGREQSVAELLQDFLAMFRPKEIIAFETAYTCSKPRPDAFGGSAIVVTAKRIFWSGTSQALAELSEEAEALL